MATSYRRLVTGTDAEGNQAFVSDEQVEGIRFRDSHPEGGMWKVWGSDPQPSLPTSGDSYDYDTGVPPLGGFRYEIFRVVPESWANEHGGRYMGTTLHQTPTVDLLVILDGEVWLELGNGEERLVKAGDTIVQNGTSHAWHNRSDAVCTMASVLIGADHVDGPEWMKV